MHSYLTVGSVCTTTLTLFGPGLKVATNLNENSCNLNFHCDGPSKILPTFSLRTVSDYSWSTVFYRGVSIKSIETNKCLVRLNGLFDGFGSQHAALEKHLHFVQYAVRARDCRWEQFQQCIPKQHSKCLNVHSLECRAISLCYSKGIRVWHPKMYLAVGFHPSYSSPDDCVWTGLYESFRSH